MNKLFFVFAVAGVLAACDQSDTATVPGPGDTNAAEENAAVVLPPAILASKIYRCKDNDLVYIDWLSDNISANFRAAPGDTPTRLVAPAAGEAMAAEGYSLSGDPTAATITLARPDKGAQVCKA